MKMRFAFAIAISVLLSGCFSPQLTRRYAELSADSSSSDPSLIWISATSLGAPPGRTSSTLLASDASVQVAAISALSNDETVASPQQVVQVLTLPLSHQRTSPSVPSYTRFSRRLVFTTDYTEPGRNASGDRLDYLAIEVSLSQVGSPTGPEFTAWSRMASDAREVSWGELSYQQSLGFEPESTFDTLSPELSSLSLSPSRSTELNESIRLSRWVPPLYTRLVGGNATLIQRGERDIDLIGLLSVDVTLQIAEGPSFPVVTRFSADGPALQMGQLRVPASCSAVVATYSARGQLRHITEGDDTHIESDDHVEFWDVVQTGVPAPVELVSSDELNAPVWFVQGERSGELMIFTPDIPVGGIPKPLHFTSYGDALNFITWLKQASATQISNYRLVVDYGDDERTTVTQRFLTSASIGSLDLNQSCREDASSASP